MIVYVETNFLLELALGREQGRGCRQLLDWCRDQRLDLRLPAYALAEAQSAFVKLRADRLRAIETLKTQARDLARMTRGADLGKLCNDAGEALSASTEVDRASLNQLVRELYSVASFIPLDKSAVELAEIVRSVGSVKGHGDLMVFGSILQDLSERSRAGTPTPALFVTRDTDFGGDAGKWLRPYSCEAPPLLRRGRGPPEREHRMNELALAALRSRITRVFPAQIRTALESLTDEQVWWRPNEESNSIGNIVLHLAGSLNHFLNRNIGGIEYTRDRAAEFAERREIPKSELLALFDEMVARAEHTFDVLTPERLDDPSPEPKMHTIVLEDLMNVLAHLANHAGQIVWIAKMLHAGEIDDVWIHTHRELGAWKRKP